MITENDILMEVMHLASQALVADLSDVKRKALADIADAIAGLLPVEGERREAETQRVTLAKIETRLRVFNTSNLHPEQVEWLDETRQIALDATVPVERAARGSAPTDGRAASMTPPKWKAEHNYINACDIVAMSLKIPGHKFTAYVEQATDKEWDGLIMEDGKGVVLVHTIGRGKSFTGRVTQYAMRGVASHVGHRSRLRANKRSRLGILTPEQELARTVAEQKEE